MRNHSRSFTLTLVVPALAVLLTACGEGGGGPYEEVKQAWDSPRSDAQLQEMRHRLALTQQDH